MPLAWLRPVLYGTVAGVVLLLLYLSLLALVSGGVYALAQFAELWYFIIALALGFGLQVALYTRLRVYSAGSARAGNVVAASGGTSTVAMISCCAHYATNILPIIGATGLVALVAQYQTALFWASLAVNAAGVMYIGFRLIEASRHMASMEDPT